MDPSVQLSVNGERHEVRARPGTSLLQVLHDDLDLTGAKYACGEGACGACTVLAGDDPVRACVTPLADVVGRPITTVEALAATGRLDPVQEAFLEAGAMQCGYCTPGMILTVRAMLAADPEPSEAALRTGLEGNVCRCCAYPRILEAARHAASLGKAGGHGRQQTAPISASLPAPVSPVSHPTPWDLANPGKQDFFAVLDDGLVMVASPDTTSWFAPAGAWLHVGADGTVTAFTGKVDVGQNNRTSLSLVVAEELQTNLENVRLVMGDTDVVPYDIGTFGSRSMVETAQSLRHAAAAARAWLIDAAARRLSTPPGRLAAVDGAVRVRRGRRSVSYGELVRGGRVVANAPRRVTVAAPSGWGRAGRATPRVDDVAIVTGAKRYPTDLTRPGLLHGRVLRAPAHGATLKSVDLAAAAAVEGAMVVREGAFVGVAAEDPGVAAAALERIEARWDLQPQVAEAELVEHLRAHPVEAEGWEGAIRDEQGRVDAALAAAPVSLSATYTTAYIAHAPLETRAALAEWDGARLTVWTGTQMPFGVRSELAETLDLDEAAVRVVAIDAGGGFGGKHATDVAVEAARLALATGRPVKVRWTRDEEFTWAYFRPAAVIDVRSGLDDAGRLVAWDFTNINAGGAAIHTPYTVPNRRIVFQPAASPLPQGSYRALAATANHFARESHMDELAHAAGADPLEFRLRHLDDRRLAAVFEAAAAKAGWSHKRSSGEGIGVAGGIEKGGRVAACAEVRVSPDGRLEVLRVVEAYECGAIVNPDTVANQVQGAVVMGLGGALFEAIHFDGGRILNGSMSEYRVPRVSDVPDIEVVLLDRRDEPSAGAGETPLVAVAPALANAIFAAAGTRIRAMPLAPDGVVAGAGVGATAAGPPPPRRPGSSRRGAPSGRRAR